MRNFVKSFVALLLISAFCVNASSQTDCYPNLPPVLNDKAEEAARFIVQNNPSAIGKSADGRFNPVVGVDNFSGQIFLYSVLDAIAPTDEAAPFRTIQAYRYMVETARTDKQVGASARSEGTTTLAEKPGWVDLLGLAIEHGGIEQNVKDTTLTLSTTPYALIAAVSGDTAENYSKYQFFTRIGMSASFNISDNDNPLASASRQQLTEWSVRARLYGDQSVRSKRFIQFWTEKIRPKIVRRLIVINEAEKLINRAGDNPQVLPLFNRRKLIMDPADPAADPAIKAVSLNDKIATYLNANAGKPPAEKITDIRQMILCHMREYVFGPVQRNEIAIDVTTRLKLNEGIVPALISANEELKAARKLLDEFIGEFTKQPQLTVAYTNNRVPDGQNYQVFKLLFRQGVFHPMNMTANVGVSIYNTPDPLLRQQRVRDIAAALSFEGDVQSPFMSKDEDMSKITYSFTGRYQRLFENRFFAGRKADIGTFQFRMEFPFLEALSVPISISYSNATEKTRQDGVRVNFGLKFDADKLATKRLR